MGFASPTTIAVLSANTRPKDNRIGAVHLVSVPEERVIIVSVGHARIEQVRANARRRQKSGSGLSEKSCPSLRRA